MWEKVTGFTTDLLSSGDLYFLFQRVDIFSLWWPTTPPVDALYRQQTFITRCSSLPLPSRSRSLSICRISQTRARATMTEDVVYRTYIKKKKDYNLPLLLFKFIFCFILHCLFEVCIDAPSPTSLKNLLLIIDKLQQYQYHICLYSCFKDNFVVYFLTLAF